MALAPPFHYLNVTRMATGWKDDAGGHGATSAQVPPGIATLCRWNRPPATFHAHDGSARGHDAPQLQRVAAVHREAVGEGARGDRARHGQNEVRAAAAAAEAGKGRRTLVASVRVGVGVGVGVVFFFQQQEPGTTSTDLLSGSNSI